MGMAQYGIIALHPSPLDNFSLSLSSLGLGFNTTSEFDVHLSSHTVEISHVSLLLPNVGK
jgi:hypothetical protein